MEQGLLFLGLRSVSELCTWSGFPEREPLRPGSPALEAQTTVPLEMEPVPVVGLLASLGDKLTGKMAVLVSGAGWVPRLSSEFASTRPCRWASEHLSWAPGVSI